MTRRLKVYGITDYIGARTVRLICACSSLRELATLANISRTRAERHASVTGDEEECELARSAPRRLFWRDINGGAWTGPRS